MSEKYYSGKIITDILQQEIDNADLLSRILSRLKYAEDVCADGDMISRQAAIDDAHRQIWYRMNPGMRDRIDEWLRALPSVSPARPTGWIPVKFRPLTDEEQEEYPNYCYMADCQMPDDEEEILVTVKSSKGNLHVEKDICYFDDGFSPDSGYDWQTDIAAWQPLPEPYKTESEGEDG